MGFPMTQLVNDPVTGSLKGFPRGGPRPRASPGPPWDPAGDPRGIPWTPLGGGLGTPGSPMREGWLGFCFGFWVDSSALGAAGAAVALREESLTPGPPQESTTRVSKSMVRLVWGRPT